MVDFVDKVIYQQLVDSVRMDLYHRFPKGQFLITEQLQNSKYKLYNHIVVIYNYVDPEIISEYLTSETFQQDHEDLFSGSFKLIAVNTQPQTLFTTYCYYSYYCGFLLNQIVYPFGLVLTPSGLYKVDTEGDHLLISNSWLKILDCLDYSFNTWNKGFIHPEELFSFLEKSKFFYPQLQLDNLTTNCWSTKYELVIWDKFKSWLTLRTSERLSSEPATEIKERLQIRLQDCFPFVKF